MDRCPEPFRQRWRVKPGGEWDAARVVLDEGDTDPSDVPIATIDQMGEEVYDEALAAYIVALHNAQLDEGDERRG